MVSHAARIRILKSYGRMTIVDDEAVAATLHSSGGSNWTHTGDDIEECVRRLYVRIQYAMIYHIPRMV